MSRPGSGSATSSHLDLKNLKTGGYWPKPDPTQMQSAWRQRGVDVN
jgi:hypothetical protein